MDAAELLDLAELHVKTVEAGQAASGLEAPRLRLFRTAAGNIWRIRGDLESQQVVKLAMLAREEPAVEDFEAHPPNLEAYRQTLNGYLPVSRAHCGPAFLFPDELPDAARAIVVTEANRAVCAPYFPWVLKEWADPIHPVVVALEDGVAVSLCHSARTSRTASEAGLETVEAARGQGYAPEVVAEWARGVRTAGRLPMYSTDWTNTASRRVAEKLDLKLYGEDTALT